MRNLIVVLLALTICSYWNEAFSAGVSVSGVVPVDEVIVDGGLLDINGTGFGSHDLNIEWLGGKNGLIESSEINQTPTNQNGFLFDQGWPNQVISSSEVHSGQQSLYAHMDNSGGNFSGTVRYDLGSSLSPGEEVFISWWVRRDFVGDGQWKMFRINWQNDIQDDFPQIVMFNWYNSNQMYIRPGNTISGNSVSQWPEYPSISGNWYRIDYHLKESSIGSADGFSVVSLHDPASGASISVSIKNNIMTYLDGSRLHRWLLWQNYIGNGITDQETWTDDIYIQRGTQARVELGDSPTWDACTFREIQYPANWGDSKITINFNQGSFSSNSIAYLYVVDAAGNVSNNGDGVEITIGDYGGGTPPPVDGPPAVAFTSPTTEPAYTLEMTAESQVLSLEGTATDDNTIQSVMYATDNGQNGTATTNDGFSTWSVPVTVNKNETVVTTVTVTDDAGQNTSKTMTITCTCPVGWDARVQTGDTAWADSSVTYCVRLLVQGDSVTDGASQVVLGFQGRSSGDYTIRNVSIAERDIAGSEGDVVDSTWAQVTFGGGAWNNSITVGSGLEKLSDPVSLNLKPGSDYYVTFKIDAPSVYLDPPTGYRELYFPSADHTSDVDWSGNGYSVTQDYHALSKIYIYSPAGSLAPPASFQWGQ